jgi:hypothetical protein
MVILPFEAAGDDRDCAADTRLAPAHVDANRVRLSAAIHSFFTLFLLTVHLEPEISLD